MLKTLRVNRGVTNVIPVSENNVVCTGPGISGALIVDTLTGGKEEIKARNLMVICCMKQQTSILPLISE